MAQHGSQYYPSLVHQHNTLPQPPALSASGTFVLSSNPHDMLTNATTHDSPSPPSTSSSSNSRLNLPPVFSMPPVPPSGSQATTPDSYEARYRRDDRYDPPLMEKGIDADRIAVRHQIRYQFREAVEERDGARPYRVPGSRVNNPDGQIYDRIGARLNPSPQPPASFSGDERRSEMHESMSASPSSQHSFIPSHSRSGSSSATSSAPRPQSPIYGVETSLFPHPSMEPPGSLVHLLWAPTKTTSNLGGKNKKQRLYSVDRKIICEFAAQNPTYKQEEIARKFNIERSTVSKILKHKDRWLRISNDESVYYAKERVAKYPALEWSMRDWVKKCHEDNVPMTDALITARALELARGQNLDEKAFKASPGWVENFKHRNGISKNRWDGRTSWNKCYTALPEDFENLEEVLEKRRWHSQDKLPPLPGVTEEEMALTRQLQPTSAPIPSPIVEPEPQRVETVPQVRRHPVWLPDQSDHVQRPIADPSRIEYPQAHSHTASPARPYEAEQITEPSVGVTAFSEDGSVHVVVPQGPNFRPNVGAEPSHNDAETSIDTLLIFFKNVRPDMLSMEQRHLLHTIKEELFMAGN